MGLWKIFETTGSVEHYLNYRASESLIDTKEVPMQNDTQDKEDGLC